MPDLLHDSSAWLDRMMQKHCSRTVLYRRGDAEADLDATIGRTYYEVEDSTGLRVKGHVVDFIISAGVFAPLFGTPEQGDRIAVDGILHEVMSLAGEGHWRWSDPHRTTMRIHSKEIGVDP